MSVAAGAGSGSEDMAIDDLDLSNADEPGAVEEIDDTEDFYATYG